MRKLVILSILLVITVASGYAEEWYVQKISESKRTSRSLYYVISSYRVAGTELCVYTSGYIQIVDTSKLPFSFILRISYPNSTELVETNILSVEKVDVGYRIQIQRCYHGEKIGCTPITYITIPPKGYSFGYSTCVPLREGLYNIRTQAGMELLAPRHEIQLRVTKTPPKPSISISDIINSIIQRILELLKDILDFFG